MTEIEVLLQPGHDFAGLDPRSQEALLPCERFEVGRCLAGLRLDVGEIALKHGVLFHFAIASVSLHQMTTLAARMLTHAPEPPIAADETATLIGKTGF